MSLRRRLRGLVERALEEEIRRVKMERLKTVIGEALKGMDVGVEEWVEAIRESRLER
ncbi:MAG: hypothetical protein LM584_06910 [Desulfurococcaceae archaeon]|nr:hypothetical protein [Desulfurococcaceae archaeon]